MVDAPESSFTPEPPSPPVGPEGKTGFAAFVASTLGKVIIGGAAIVIALAVVGTLVFVFLLAPTMNTSSNPTTVTVNPGGAQNASSSSASATATEPPVDPLEKPLESDFTFRNVFAPTVKAQYKVSDTASSTTSGSTSTSSTSSVTVPADTLYLSSIQTVDGKKTATFIWNSKTYTLGAGETLDSTPWKVVEIGESSVVMLFGDTEVTLTLGQGLSK